MKKLIALLLAAVLFCTFIACGKTDTPEPAEPVELIVFAAASMTETMNQIAELYKAVAPHVTITFTFDSSGTLLTQIKEGAPCDVFISAAQKQINELDITSDKNPDGADYIVPESRFNLVENRVALVVPAGNPAGILTFDDAAAASSIALGNADVPVGQYSEEIFTNMGVWDAMQGNNITFGSNVKEVTTWVGEGVVECGVVYSTDAFSADLEIVAYAPAGMLQTPVVYPAAALKQSDCLAEAEAFLAYLKTADCTAVFRSVGFEIPS